MPLSMYFWAVSTACWVKKWFSNMLCALISSWVPREIVKPQYRHVIMMSSWLGLTGAPQRVQLVGISLGAVGVGAAIRAASIIGGAVTAGAGAWSGVGVVGRGDAEGMEI